MIPHASEAKSICLDINLTQGLCGFTDTKHAKTCIILCAIEVYNLLFNLTQPNLTNSNLEPKWLRTGFFYKKIEQER